MARSGVGGGGGERERERDRKDTAKVKKGETEWVGQRVRRRDAQINR